MLRSIGFFLFLQRTSRHAMQRTHFVRSCGPSLRTSLNLTTVCKMTWGPVSTVTKQQARRLDNRGSFPGGAADFRYTTASKTDSGSHHASNPMGKRSLSPRGLRGQSVKLTTKLHLVPRLRTCVAIPPLPHAPSGM
jgi:hypothetical protein